MPASSLRRARRAPRLAAALALTLTGGLLAGTAPAQAAPAPAARTAATAAYDTTSAKERARVDRVKKPSLSWKTCRGSFTCATVTLPTDYDHPTGATTKVALLRVKARTSNKIGTLFVNPGGPGASGTDFATSAADIFPAAIRDRFDIVGFDPRGTGASSNVRCFASSAAQASALAPLDAISFPDSTATANAYLGATRKLGRGCATTGLRLSASMSTAQVARDLDVLRRAVGDSRLSYIGFSYGTYIGQVYANLFPDRVRALALDGVVDPTAWQGSTATRNDPQWDRIRSAEGSKKALDAILARCGTAGPSRCGYAAYGNPTTGFAALAARLKATPLMLDDGTGTRVPYGYDDLVGQVLDDLYAVDGADSVDQLLSDLTTLTRPATSAAARQRAARAVAASSKEGSVRRQAVSAAGYDNGIDAFTSVNCTDSVQLDHLSSLPAAAVKADARVPYFGALWAWNALGCATDTFTARDEDAYRGSFTRRTRAPLLFVGDTYDPVTSLAAATKADGLAPNSALVSSQSWGHTAYNTSGCVTSTVDTYLLTGKAPAAAVTRCTGDYQPFAASTSPSVAQTPVSEALAGAR